MFGSGCLYSHPDLHPPKFTERCAASLGNLIPQFPMMEIHGVWFPLSMDWFTGQITRTPSYFIRKSMVSGFDFPLSQSIDQDSLFLDIFPVGFPHIFPMNSPVASGGEGFRRPLSGHARGHPVAWRPARARAHVAGGGHRWRQVGTGRSSVQMGKKDWVVSWNTLYFSIYWEHLGTIIPTDWYFPEGLKPPTRKHIYIYTHIYIYLKATRL